MVRIACVPHVILEPTITQLPKYMEMLKEKNIIPITDDTIQAGLDGIYICKNGVPLRETKTEFLHKNTWQKLTSGQKESDLVEYQKWIEHPTETLSWYFHPLTKITLNDVKEQKKIGHIDFGNNIMLNCEINGKKCIALILSDDQEIEKLEDWFYTFSELVE